MRKSKTSEPKPPQRDPRAPLFTDLSSITRESERFLTTVTLEVDIISKEAWLQFGQAQIHSDERHRVYRLEARMDATDPEHDSAYAVRLPLIGVQFEGVLYHSTLLSAWVHPDAGDEFHVPSPGYNPIKHPDAILCKSCPDRHIIVPEGFYVPPFDPELYQKVRGKRVEIRIGPAYKS